MARFHQDDNGHMVPCGATKVPCPKGGAFHTDAEDTAGANRNREAWLREKNKSPLVKKDPYAGKTMVSSATGAEFTIGEKFTQAGEEYYKATDEDGNEVTLAANNMGRFEEKIDEPEEQEAPVPVEKKPTRRSRKDSEQKRLEREAKKLGVSVDAYRLAEATGSVAIPGSPVPGEVVNDKDNGARIWDWNFHGALYTAEGEYAILPHEKSPDKDSFTFQRIPSKAKKPNEMSDAEFEALVNQPVVYYKTGEGVGAYMTPHGKWREVEERGLPGEPGEKRKYLLIDPAYIPTSEYSLWGNQDVGIRVGDGVFLHPNGMLTSVRGRGEIIVHIPGSKQIESHYRVNGKVKPDESVNPKSQFYHYTDEDPNARTFVHNPYFQYQTYFSDNDGKEYDEFIWNRNGGQRYHNLQDSDDRVYAGHEPGYMEKDTAYSARKNYTNPHPKNVELEGEILKSFAKERRDSSNRAVRIFKQKLGSWENWQEADLAQKRKIMEARQDMIAIIQSREETVKHLMDKKSPYHDFAREVIRAKAPIPSMEFNTMRGWDEEIKAVPEAMKKNLEGYPDRVIRHHRGETEELREESRTDNFRYQQFMIERQGTRFKPKKDMEWFSYPTDEEM